MSKVPQIVNKNNSEDAQASLKQSKQRDNVNKKFKENVK